MQSDANQPIHLDLLGGFDLQVGSTRVDVPAAAQRVLAFLALAPRQLKRAYVAASLWTGGTDASAQHSLRSALWRLQRAVIGARVIEVSHSHLLLADDVEVDVRRQVAMARNLLTGDGCPDDVLNGVVLESELLPDWYDDWVLLERERLVQLRVHALGAAAERLADEGRFGDAVDVAFAALRGDPLCERAHHMLIRAYLAGGDRVEAIRHYRSYCALVQQKFGLTPSAEIASLIEQCAPLLPQPIG